ncbi:MAG TPA: hypothetical protein VE993_05435 [Stellaceae bacterium]|nr:hypothetical protein [Stellaceae bacterium]
MESPGNDADRPIEATEIPRQEEEKRKKILRARPVADAIDHSALTREIIARFPKILAELAK